MSSSMNRLAPRALLVRSLAQPGVQDLPGIGSRRQDRVVTQHPRVAERRARLALPSTSQIGRVDVDHEAAPTGPGAHRPRRAQDLADDGFELADMPKGE